MKILKLNSENVKRLSAVEIKPNGNMVTVGGKNGAGKSSVLDSIAYALGGQTLVPSEPIRNGQANAEIVVDLGELVVTRKFRRERVYTQCDPSVKVGGGDVGVIAGHEHNDKCQWKFGPTTSTLVVTNKDGAKYPTPQAVLDKLLGKLTFDPLAFSRAEAKDQNAVLRRLVGIDTTELDEERKMYVSLRSDLKKQIASQDALIAAAKHYPEAPATELGTAEITKTLADVETKRNHAADLTSQVLKAGQKKDNVALTLQRLDEKIEDLEAHLVKLRGDRVTAADYLDKVQAEIKKVIALETAAKAEVPDSAAIQKKLSEIEETNQHVRANKTRENYQRIRVGITAKMEAADRTVKELDAKKASILDNVKFPVPGLGLSDNGVTFNGVPFEQASTSEQLKTSVAIGLAMNPLLKVLLVRDGNALDADSLKQVAKQAEEADAQVWMEYVATDASTVAVMIEDGHVAG